MALQIVQAGNLRSALFIVKLAREAGVLDRVCVASDTPTGTGVMPMGVLKSVCELASLGDLAPEVVIALATGNNARAFRLLPTSGTLAVGAAGRPGGVRRAGRPRWPRRAQRHRPRRHPRHLVRRHRRRGAGGRSRNTPLAKRLAAITGAAVAGGGH